MITIQCPNCPARYSLAREKLTRDQVKMRCPQCQSVFTFEVPPPEPAPPPAPEAPAPETQATFNPYRTQRLDPIPGDRTAVVATAPGPFRDLLEAQLREVGCQVSAYTDGQEALNHIEAQPPSITVLNVYLPTILGINICERLRTEPRFTNVRVVLIGSIFRTHRFRRAPTSTYDADTYVEETATGPELREQFQALLDGEPLPGPSDETVSAPPDPGRLEEARRLVRIILDDVILYDKDRAEEAIASGNFFESFSQDLTEGIQLFQRRFPDLAATEQDWFLDLFKETVEDRRRTLAEGQP